MKLKDRLKWHKKKLLEQIDQERERQIERWKTQNRSPERWAIIKAEENGEFIQALNNFLEYIELDEKTFEKSDELFRKVRDELIQDITVGMNILDMINEYIGD